MNHMLNSIIWSRMNVHTGLVLMGRTTTLSVGVMTGDACTLVKILVCVVTSPFLKITSRLMQPLLTYPRYPPYSSILQLTHTHAHTHTHTHAHTHIHTHTWKRPRLLVPALNIYTSSPRTLQHSCTTIDIDSDLVGTGTNWTSRTKVHRERMLKISRALGWYHQYPWT